MKIRYAMLASVVLLASSAYGQDYNNRIGFDVTPRAQIEINRENDKREAEARRLAEAQAEQARRRAAELERSRIQAEAARDAARIQAQGDVEAAKNRRPDVCLNCSYWR